MRLLNSFLRVSQRALGRAGRDLVSASQRISVSPSFTADETRTLQRNQSFANRHKGQRCFVIATGPSLKEQNIDSLGDEITFAMSGFWQHPVVEKWQPTYYCFSDPAYFNGSLPMLEFFRSMGKRIHSSSFFAPLAAREVIENQLLLPLDHTNWVAFRGELNDNHADKRQIDLTRDIPGAMSVSQLCIMAAIYMSCSPIYLLGLDHDWLAHKGEAGHFYSGHGGLEKHPDFKPQLTDWSYKFLMECQLKLWLGYETLKSIAERKGIHIVNATHGGFLDVFDREDYRNVIARPQ